MKTMSREEYREAGRRVRDARRAGDKALAAFEVARVNESLNNETYSPGRWDGEAAFNAGLRDIEGGEGGRGR